MTELRLASGMGPIRKPAYEHGTSKSDLAMPPGRLPETYESPRVRTSSHMMTQTIAVNTR